MKTLKRVKWDLPPLPPKPTGPISPKIKLKPVWRKTRLHKPDFLLDTILPFVGAIIAIWLFLFIIQLLG